MVSQARLVFALIAVPLLLYRRRRSGSSGSSGSSPTKPPASDALDSAVDTQLPTSGPGYVAVSPPANLWGRPLLVTAIKRAGAAWAARHPEGPRIMVHDLSHHGGGFITSHVSHQHGVDVDIGLMRNDGRELGTAFTETSYSRELTQELVSLLRASGPIDLVLFNDDKVTGVQPWPDHHNHLHVRYRR